MSCYSHGHGATPAVGYIFTSIVYSCGLRLVGAIRLLYSRSFESGHGYRMFYIRFLGLAVAIGCSIAMV